MKKVLIGATRSKGSIPTEDKKEIVFDNIVLSFADYQGPNSYFQLSKEPDRVKIRTSDFEDITGVKPGVFLSRLSDFIFKKAKIGMMLNDYDKAEVTYIRFDQQQCFQAFNADTERAPRKTLSEEDLGFGPDGELLEEEGMPFTFAEDADGNLRVDTTTGEVAPDFEI